MAELTDAQIDADLRIEGFDPADDYPEHGHEALRRAYRAGYEATASTPTVREAGAAVERLFDQAWNTACDEVGRRRALVDRDTILAALTVPRVLYHWAARTARESIEQHGLRPGSPSADGSWVPPHVCLSASPSHALALTNATGPLDLWMVLIGDCEELVAVDAEWRTTNPVRAWWVAERGETIHPTPTKEHGHVSDLQ